MDDRTRELICRTVDGCAGDAEVKELRAMAENDQEIREELDLQEQAAGAIRSVGMKELEDDVVKVFDAGVYNRLERRAGWVFVCVGTLLFLGYGLYELLTDPSVHTVYRLGIAATLIGFGLLISRVVRVRMKLRPHDRYKEVIR